MIARLVALFLGLSVLANAAEETPSATATAVETASATAAEVVTASASAPVPAPIELDRHLTTLRNDIVEVDLTSERGALVEMRVVGHNPIKLPKHYLAEGEEQDLEQSLAVLGHFYPKASGGDHNIIRGFGLETYKASDGSSLGEDWVIVGGGEGQDTITYEFTREDLNIVYRLTYNLLTTKPGVSCRFEVVNNGEADHTFRAELWPLNGVHQDVGNNENYYLTIATNTGGEDGDFDTHSMPTPFAAPSPIIRGSNLDYVALKSRFFAAVFVPRSVGIDGATATAAPESANGFSMPEKWELPTEEAGDIAGPSFFGGVLNVGAYGYTQDRNGNNPRQHAMIMVGVKDSQNRDWVLPPGKTFTFEWDIFTSSMRKQDLAMLTPAEAKLEFTDSFHRFFRLLSNILTYLLNAIAMIPFVGYGLAVVLLTVLLKALLHTTTYKQQKSMMKMAKLAPEMKKLQERYGNDRQAMAAKQMELWKEHGVNPFGGCLPIFIQAPIFIALYQTFSHSADMRGESFLWLADLTLPDQLIHMPWLFGLTLNPLPILYILASLWMSFSMKQPAAASGNDQQQQMMKMMRWLPVIFGFIFYNMPSGLVLYFTCSAILGALEMRWIRARLEAKGL